MSCFVGPLSRGSVCGQVGAVLSNHRCSRAFRSSSDCFSSCSDILRMDATNADALYVRGLCLYYEDCIDKAVQFFVQALRMAPDHEKARLACRVKTDQNCSFWMSYVAEMLKNTAEITLQVLKRSSLMSSTLNFVVLVIRKKEKYWISSLNLTKITLF